MDRQDEEITKKRGLWFVYSTIPAFGALMALIISDGHLTVDFWVVFLLLGLLPLLYLLLDPFFKRYVWYSNNIKYLFWTGIYIFVTKDEFSRIWSSLSGEFPSNWWEIIGWLTVLILGYTILWYWPNKRSDI